MAIPDESDSGEGDMTLKPGVLSGILDGNSDLIRSSAEGCGREGRERSSGSFRTSFRLRMDSMEWLNFTFELTDEVSGGLGLSICNKIGYEDDDGRLVQDEVVESGCGCGGFLIFRLLTPTFFLLP